MLFAIVFGLQKNILKYKHWLQMTCFLRVYVGLRFPSFIQHFVINFQSCITLFYFILLVL
jgi:hypothetical protein